VTGDGSGNRCRRFFVPIAGDDRQLFMLDSSEVDTGSREENASKQESRASVLIQSEPL